MVIQQFHENVGEIMMDIGGFPHDFTIFKRRPARQTIHSVA
jgi:hypothetical protein